MPLKTLKVVNKSVRRRVTEVHRARCLHVSLLAETALEMDVSFANPVLCLDAKPRLFKRSPTMCSGYHFSNLVPGIGPT